MKDKIFVNGYVTKDVPDTAPDYILGKGAFRVDEMIEFLNSHRNYAVNGYLNFTTLRGKDSGKRYTELDLYQYEKNRAEKSTLTPEAIETIKSARDRELQAQVDYDGLDQIDPNSIPF